MVMVKFDIMYGCGDMPGLRCNVLQLCYTRSTCIEHKYIFHTHTLNLYFLLVNSFTFFIKQYQCPYLVSG